MNANIKGMLDHFKKKKMDGIIETRDGRLLNDKEARHYLHWCLENGFTDLYSAPEFDDFFDEDMQKVINL